MRSLISRKIQKKLTKILTKIENILTHWGPTRRLVPMIKKMGVKNLSGLSFYVSFQRVSFQ